jgi:septal ring factor EnvC (AmiA/AmiB activator)
MSSIEHPSELATPVPEPPPHAAQPPAQKRPPRKRKASSRPQPRKEHSADNSRQVTAIQKAILQVRKINDELKRIVNDLNGVLKSLDQAEREKTATEDELEKLKQSLTGLHRVQREHRHHSTHRSPSQPVAANRD